MVSVFDIVPDYEFYVSVYRGTMDEDSFNAVVSDATAEVNYAIRDDADLTKHEWRIQMAVCSVAETAGNLERRRTSYSASKVSESFSSTGFPLTAEAAILRWLGGLGLLKQGRWL